LPPLERPDILNGMGIRNTPAAPQLLSRRWLLRGAATLAGATAAAQPPAPRKTKVLVVGGHPGDPEYGCGGAIARYTALSNPVVVLYLNRGEKGCPETAPEKGSGLRVPEAKRACEILGARAIFADQCDGHAVVDAAHYDSFTKIIQSEQPDVIFTHWPLDNHADHRSAYMLTYEAWQRMGRKSALYFYEVSDGEDTVMFSPTDYCDITAQAALKRAACYAHASQAPDKFYALQSAVTRFRGIESGYAEAEAFVRHIQSPPGRLP
jgi:N-acetylglucosamine malate deacetylase 1